MNNKGIEGVDHWRSEAGKKNKTRRLRGELVITSLTLQRLLRGFSLTEKLNCGRDLYWPSEIFLLTFNVPLKLFILTIRNLMAFKNERSKRQAER